MSYLSSILTNDEVVEFIDNRVDDISITRDATAGTKVSITFCHSNTGCPVEVKGKDLKGAITLAVKIDKL